MEGIKGMVSVLIPCYNHERFVPDCMNSILNQTYTQYEVIICDDCSRDQSVAVIERYREKFQSRGIRFELMKNDENQGITKNLNRMLERAHGEFIKIIASDDMLGAEYMAELTTFLNENPNLQFVFSDGYKVRESATYPVKENCFLGTLLTEMPDCVRCVFERVYEFNFVPAPALLFRRSVLEEVGGYDESIAIEDLEMLLRVLKRYPKGMGVCPKKLVYYRINENSLTSMTNNAGAVRRIRFMYDNSVAIAKKYKEQVSRNVYRRRMWTLHKEYMLKRLIVFAKSIKEKHAEKNH